MSASSKLGNTRNISESETFPIERKSPLSRLLASVIRTLHQPRSVVLWHYCHYLHVSFSCRLTAGAGSGGLHVGRGSVSAVFIQFPRGVSPPEQGQSAPLTCLELLSSPILVYR